MATTDPVVFTRAGFLRGARAAVPLVIATLPFGLVAGIAAQGQGLSLLETALMSGCVFAGAAQIVALASWSHPASILAAAAAAFVVNLRLALMGPVLSPWLDRLRGWRLWGSLFMMADQNWALSVTRMQGGDRDAAFLIGTGTNLYVFWVISSLVGFLLGATLKLPGGHPLFFVALALFVAMLATMFRGKADILPWAVSAGVALVVAHLMPGTTWHIAIGAVAGGIAGAARDRLRGVDA